MLYNDNTFKFFKFPIVFGNSPESKFIYNSIVFKEVALEISNGMLPDNLLKDKFNTSNDFSFPIEAGINPEILFLKRFNVFKNSRFEISFGKVPDRLLSDKLIATTLLFIIVIPFQVETGLDKSHLEIQVEPFVDLLN